MAVIRNLVVKIGADISGLSKGLKSAQQRLEKVSKEIAKIGSSFSVNITAPLTAFATLAVKASSELESSMLTVANSFDGTAKQMQSMTDIAKKMSKSTIYSVSEVASAMKYMSQAGYETTEMEKSLASVSNLATGAQVSLEDATKSVVTVLGQFNLDSKDTGKVANIMATALSNSYLSMEELTTGLSLVGNVATQIGVPIESVAGALTVLANAGYSGEDAGTYLKNILLKLQKPTTEAKKAIESLGLSIKDVNPETNSLVEIIDKFTKAGLTSADATAIFGESVDSAFMSIMAQGKDKLDEMTSAMGDMTSAEQMAEKYNSTLEGQLKQIKALLNDIATQFGDILLPMIKKFLEQYIEPILSKFSNLSDNTKNLIVKIGMVASAIGPVLLLISKVVKSCGELSGVFSFLTGKVGIIIAVITALVTAFIHLYKTNDEFRAQVQEVWEKLKDAIKNIVEPLVKFLISAVQKVVSAIMPLLESLFKVVLNVVSKTIDIINELWQQLVDFWNNNEQFRDGIASIWNQIKNIIEKVAKLISDIWEKYGERIFSAVSRLSTKIMTLVETVLTVIVSLVSKLLELIEPIWDDLCDLILTVIDVILTVYEFLEPVINLVIELVSWLVEEVGGALTTIIDALKPFIEAIRNVLTIITEVIQAIVSLFKGDFTGAFEHIKNVGQGFKDFFGNLFEGVLSLGKGFVDAIVGLFTNMGSKLGSICEGIFNTVGGWFKNLWQGIKGTASNIWDGITGVFGKIGNWMGGVFKDGLNWGKNLVSMIGDGIKSGVNKVKDACSSVIGKIKGWLGFGSPTDEGPGRYSDKWAPNLMDMYSEGIRSNVPEIQSAVDEVAEVLSGINGDENKGVVSTGDTSIGADVLNGLLTAFSMNSNLNSKDSADKPIELSIDGTVFARLIYPKLVKEFQRNGILLTEGVKT